jgi:uroporphyrinogen-III synthase
VRLLVTRPEPDNLRTAALLRQRGHEVVLAPLLHMEPTQTNLGDGPWVAIVITSINAVRAIAAHPQFERLKKLPLFAVGGRSADAARVSGFAQVVSAGGDARDLVRVISERLPHTDLPLLYLAGEDRAANIAADLAPEGLVMHTVAVYRAAKTTCLPPDAHAAIADGTIDGVLHFSRRSVETYLDCAGVAGLLAQALAGSHYCLSQQVSEPLAAAGAGNIRIAARPNETALLDLIGR